MKLFLVSSFLLAGSVANAQVTGDDCLYLTNCESCLTFGSTGCAWDAGLFCTGSACSEPDHCVTPAFGGEENKTKICELPQAQPPNHGVVCSGFSDCETCLSSENCAWQDGKSCQETCETGKNCVTPNYGGLGKENDKSEICALPEANNETPEGPYLSCGIYTNCQACLAAGYSFTPTGCAWSKGSVCTQTCPGGDASTCVTPNYGNAGHSFDHICALEAAQPVKDANKEGAGPAEVSSSGSGAGDVAYLSSLVGAGIAALAL